MQIGFAGYVEEHFRDLQPQWVKVAQDASVGPCDVTQNPEIASALAHGVRVVVDFRCSNIQRLTREDEARGGAPYSWFTDALAGTVELSSHGVRDWEIWGEWACPAVAQGIFGGRNYRDLLEASYAAVKRADPGAVVWTGGFGVNFGLRAYERLLEQGAHDFFDVLNLHPFVHHRPWEEAEAAIHAGFAHLRELEIRAGVQPKPLACTEFGWPVMRGARNLKSNVFDKVQAIGEDLCAEWTDHSFALFERYGVQALMYCTLRDTNGSHWGSHLGILRTNGTRKPNYPVLAEWIARGRQTSIDF